MRAIATDLAGNVGSDTTTNELTIVGDRPAVLVIPQTTNETSPEVRGLVSNDVVSMTVRIAEHS